MELESKKRGLSGGTVRPTMVVPGLEAEVLGVGVL